MTSEQPGLRQRMRFETRRISNQHRQLDSFFAQLVEAMQRDSAQEVGESFRRFREALEAHFALEEQTHFPALHGLRPDAEAELTELVREHHRFRAELDRLRTLLEAPDLEASAARLDALGAELADHEVREERLFERSTGSPRSPE